jgi:hypothetical protein
VREPAGAGALLIATVIACAGVALAVGALVGAPATFALGGAVVGFGGGFWLVYRRYRDI